MPNIRIISFNILFGAFQPRDRFESIAELLRAQEPDVVLLQECMDWEPSRLERLGAMIGMPHSFLGTSNRRGSGRRYHLGVLSRYCLDGSMDHGTAYLAHGCTEVSVEGISILNLHLNAHSEEQRLWEVEQLLEDVLGEDRVKTEDLILAGDFNALSPHDPYPDDLGKTLAGAGVDKYGNPIQFDVMQALEQANWHDPMIGLTDWATRYRTETSPSTPTRTDYILVSPGLTECVKDCRVLPLRKEESDHRPVLLELHL